MDIWFDVKETLPDTCRRVICVEKHGYMAICQYVPQAKSFYEKGHLVNTVKWMELPANPQEKQKC